MSDKKVITELTEEQQAKFPEYVEKWVSIGLNTEEVDLEPAIKAVRRCYEDAGLRMPDTYYVFDSPMQAAISIALMQDPRWPELGALTDDLYELDLMLGGEPIVDAIRPRSFSPELTALKKKAKPSKKELKDLFDRRHKEYDELVAELSSKSQNEFWSRVELAIGAQNPGSHDAGWLAFYDYMRNVLGLVEETKLAVGHIELAKHCGWWTAYENCFILQHRHIGCHLDEQGRPHNEKGMALEYRDGFGIWAIEGHKVDEQIVMRPETQTPQDIENETNADVRAIRLNRYPWPRYLQDVGAKCIDERDNVVDGTLEQLYVTENVGRRFVYTCITGRLMTSAVPDTVNTCAEAQLYLANNRKLNIIAAT